MNHGEFLRLAYLHCPVFQSSQAGHLSQRIAPVNLNLSSKQSIRPKEGRPYRITMEKHSSDDPPVHLHRHTFEVTRIGGKQFPGFSKTWSTYPAAKMSNLI
jgi:FtsP/CotA-like multicopper oxidase with cupredoxin domain